VDVYVGHGVAEDLVVEVARPESLRFVGEDAAVAVSEGGILFAGKDEVPEERKIRATWVLSAFGLPCASIRGEIRTSGRNPHDRRRSA